MAESSTELFGRSARGRAVMLNPAWNVARLWDGTDESAWLWKIKPVMNSHNGTPQGFMNLGFPIQACKALNADWASFLGLKGRSCS